MRATATRGDERAPAPLPEDLELPPTAEADGEALEAPEAADEEAGDP
jgi:hypothetical protein